MPNLVITGYGIEQSALNTFGLSESLSTSFEALIHPGATGTALSPVLAGKIAREDRAMLTPQSISCLRVSADAMAMAEQVEPLAGAYRDRMCVYTSYETVRDFHEVVFQFKSSGIYSDDKEGLLNHLGKMANAVHPLRLFRKLPTNSLYHLSKFFSLRGGGYPLRKMSLGGISLLEEAFHNLSSSEASGALLCAYGDLGKADNAQAFKKMGLIDPALPAESRVQPTAGAVALVLETPERAARSQARPLAEVISAASHFSPLMAATTADWLQAYARLAQWVVESHPVVVLYDNGAPGVGEAEIEALEQCVPAFELRRYKPWSRYAVATSGLVDLACALADPSIEAGRIIIIHGEGAGMGLGLVVVRKLATPTRGSL